MFSQRNKSCRRITQKVEDNRSKKMTLTETFIFIHKPLAHEANGEKNTITSILNHHSGNFADEPHNSMIMLITSIVQLYLHINQHMSLLYIYADWKTKLHT